MVLLSESASLTARETLTVLGSAGVRADVLTAGGLPIGRFSRWRRRLIAAPPPDTDPVGYLSLVSGLCSVGEYEAVLATHEQAWLFAAGRHLLPTDAPVAVAPIEAFDRVAGKVEFAGLCDELGVPQPQWWRCDERPAQVPYPHWVKASYGTAGRSVRRVYTAEQERQAVRELSGAGCEVMGQAPAAGEYGQVQALFEHGRLVAGHTSVGATSVHLPQVNCPETPTKTPQAVPALRRIPARRPSKVPGSSPVPPIGEGCRGTREPSRTDAQCGLAKCCSHGREARERTLRTIGSSSGSTRDRGPRE